jgi:glucose 1-dehydrogenase
VRLKDRVAIVTGAGRGIGAAIARAYAREGAAVVVNYSASAEAAAGVVREIESSGGRAVAEQADVGELSSHERLVRCALERFGRLDILVNNAAIDRRVPVLEASPEQWDAVFHVNLRGAYFLAQRAAREMVKSGGGAVLNIASVHDEQAHRNNSIYTIAKGGMKLMTRCMALEWAPLGIRVNSLSPGAILTDINRAVLADDAYKQRVLERIPLGRIGSVDDLTAAAVLLVSSEGSYITGTTFYIDGGLLL